MSHTHLPSTPEGSFRLYVSGPIRGCFDSNRPAFERAAGELADLGLASLIPHDLSSEKGRNIRTIMFRDIEALALKCHGLYMLEGWEHSLGALAEYHFGLSVGMPVWGKGWFDERNAAPCRCRLEDFGPDLQDAILLN